MWFDPHPAMKHPLLQSVSTRWSPRRGLEPCETLVVDVSEGDRVAALVNYPDNHDGPRNARRAKFTVRKVRTCASDPAGIVVMVPGLGGTARSPLMSRIASKLLLMGFVVVRVNPRGLGEGAPLARQVYHAGRSDDVSRVVQTAAQLCGGTTPLVLVGLSLGGNMVLREAGRLAISTEDSEQNVEPTADPLARLFAERCAGIVALSPILNLARCAREFERLYFGLINRAVTGRLRKFVSERHRAHPDLGPVNLPRRLSLFDFESNYTLPESGFQNIEEYYAAATAEPWLHRIGVPASIIISRDDPLARFEHFSYPDNIAATVTRYGGHLGFVSRDLTEFHDHFWGDWKVVTTVADYLRSGSLR